MSKTSASTFLLKYKFFSGSAFKQDLKFYVFSLLINSSPKVLHILYFVQLPTARLLLIFRLFAELERCEWDRYLVNSVRIFFQ